MVDVVTFLKKKYDLDEIPLCPSFGNRFNIIFLNGAGVFVFYKKLLPFFDLVTKENKLLTPVFHDVHHLQYQVGCLFLGLIHKLVTGTLWRNMEMEKTALKNMSLPYQIMLEKFEKWSDNASNFVKVEEFLFPEFVHKGEIYFKLVEQNEIMDKPTIRCLEILVLLSKFLSEC